MRTKAEIKAKIDSIRRERDYIKAEIPEHDRIYKQTCNALILALQYALGYDIDNRYWCIHCNRSHKKLRCPKCGNEDYIGVIDH